MATKKTVKAPARPAWLGHPGLAASRKKLAAAVKSAGLGERLDAIEAAAKPTIALSLKKVAKAPPGASRLGGAPEVAPPKKLQFVAQIALAEVHPLDLEGRLPDKGLLSFFAQLDFKKDDYGEVGQVVHSAGGGPPIAGAKPGAKAIGLLTPSLVLTLPYFEDPAIEQLGLSEEERESYHDEVYLTVMPEEPAHLLLGYGSSGTEHSLEGRPFLAQLASDDRIDFEQGDSQTLRYYFKGKTPSLGSVVCTLEDA